MLSTLLKLLRRTTYAALALLLALFAAVQIQQHLIRHRAEQLHADILALQLHPGTFADLQRLQTRWGAWGDYEGECTAHHCIYQIALEDVLNTRSARRSPPVPFWLVRAYLLARASPTVIYATLRLREDKIWDAEYSIAVWVVPTYRFEQQGYSIIISADYGPRLFAVHGSYRASALRRGYSISRPGGCTFCKENWVNISPQASEHDILALNDVNFSCMSFWSSCRDLPDLLPALKTKNLDQTAEQDTLDRRDCDVPLARLAQETDNIILVRRVPPTPGSEPRLDSADSTQTIEVLERIKDAHNQTIPQQHEIYADPASPSPPGNYFLFYRQPGNLQRGDFVEPGVCSQFADTPANRLEIYSGIRNDPSVGEVYRPERSAK